MSRIAPITLVIATLLLAGCDMIGGALGIESPEKVAAAREGDGKAIGGACRHAGRAIEDCYAMNKKADKASVFAGWRDMNDYMRENKIEPVTPVIAGQPATQVAKAPAEAEESKPVADKATEKSGEKAAAKGASTAKPRKAHDS
ncbi:MAG: hypothetical protein ABI702_20355 [Burkholderiales bacterium]